MSCSPTHYLYAASQASVFMLWYFLISSEYIRNKIQLVSRWYSAAMSTKSTTDCDILLSLFLVWLTSWSKWHYDYNVLSVADFPVMGFKMPNRGIAIFIPRATWGRVPLDEGSNIIFAMKTLVTRMRTRRKQFILLKPNETPIVNPSPCCKALFSSLSRKENISNRHLLLSVETIWN